MATRPRRRTRPTASRLAAVACVAVGLTMAAGGARSQEVVSEHAALPKGSNLGQLRLRTPRQILTVERKGQPQNYLIALGNMAFEASGLFGDSARRAGLSCATCHSSGDINTSFHIPGVSAGPGSADVTHELFNPRFADGLDNPLDIPSLRGVALTAPYGHDGRFASLREFARNVIVNEFAGAEPSQRILDALVIYMRQFEFLPNDKLTADGRLTDKAGPAAHRGAEIFRRRFASMNGRSCASCHTPAAQFTDGQQYDVGTGQAYETPTLLNTRFTAPYFADGSAQSFVDVVRHFDDFYELGLNARQRSDLVAYLKAVGDGRDPYESKDFAFDMREILTFAETLPRSLEDRAGDLVHLTVNTVDDELREVREHWPEPGHRQVRGILANWVLQLRRVDLAARDGRWADAKAAYRAWHDRVLEERTRVAAAQSQSLYARDNLVAYLDRFEAIQKAARK